MQGVQYLVGMLLLQGHLLVLALTVTDMHAFIRVVKLVIHLRIMHRSIILHVATQLRRFK